jgi:hypothetical protein
MTSLGLWQFSHWGGAPAADAERIKQVRPLTELTNEVSAELGTDGHTCPSVPNGA